MLGQAKCSNKRTTAELTNTQYGGIQGKAQGTQRWLLFLFPWRLDPTRAPCMAQEQSTAGLQPCPHTFFSQSSYSFVWTAIIHTRRINVQHKVLLLQCPKQNRRENSQRCHLTGENCNKCRVPMTEFF